MQRQEEAMQREENSNEKTRKEYCFSMIFGVEGAVWKKEFNCLVILVSSDQFFSVRLILVEFLPFFRKYDLIFFLET